MVYSGLLILLGISASTIAFAQPDMVDVRDFFVDEELAEEAAYQERFRRGSPELTKPEVSSAPNPAASSASYASSGSFSSSGANSQGGGFGVNSDAGGGNFGMSPGYYGTPASYAFPNFNRPNYMPYDFYALFQQFFRQLQLMAQQHAYAANYYTPSVESNTVDYEAPHGSDVGSAGSGSFAAGAGGWNTGYVPQGFYGSQYGPSGGYGGSGSGSNNGGFASAGETPGVSTGGASDGDGSALVPPGSDVVGAAAVANLSPQGGFGYADVFPDVASRFGAVGGEFPKPSGNSYGVFTSSSSGSSDINGKKTSFKTATTGINDNGKITVFTKHDP